MTCKNQFTFGGQRGGQHGSDGMGQQGSQLDGKQGIGHGEGQHRGGQDDVKQGSHILK